MPETNEKRSDVAYIVTHPEEFGFRWPVTGANKLHADHGNVKVCDDAQIPEWVDISLAVAWLGADRWLSMANGGQSFRVAIQSPMRKRCETDLRFRKDVPAMQTMAVEVLLGVRARRAVTVEKFVNARGDAFDSLVELQAAEIAHLVDQGVTAELAKTIVLGPNA